MIDWVARKQKIILTFIIEIETWQSWSILTSSRSLRRSTFECWNYKSTSSSDENHTFENFRKRWSVSSWLSRRFQSRLETQCSQELDKSIRRWFDRRLSTNSSSDTFSKKSKTSRRRLISLLSCRTNVFARLLKRLKSLSFRCSK
jgi:hypothetical protein